MAFVKLFHQVGVLLAVLSVSFQTIPDENRLYKPKWEVSDYTSPVSRINFSKITSIKKKLFALQPQLLKDNTGLMSKVIDLESSLRKKSIADLKFNDYQARINQNRRCNTPAQCRLFEAMERYGRRR